MRASGEGPAVKHRMRGKNPQEAFGRHWEAITEFTGVFVTEITYVFREAAKPLRFRNGGGPLGEPRVRAPGLTWQLPNQSFFGSSKFRFVVTAWEQMPVDVHRHHNRRMTEPHLHILGRQLKTAVLLAVDAPTREKVS